MKTQPKRNPNTTCDYCETPIYRRASTMARNRGKFCSTACRNKACPNVGPRGPNPNLAGENNPAWKGGRYIEPEKGYVMVRRPDHPRARQNGYVLEHILIAEGMLGRPLTPDEEVHHMNLDRADNRPENLQVYGTHRDHWMTEHYATVAAARDAANSKRSTEDTERV